MKRLASEPVRLYIFGLIGAAIVVIVAFGVHLTAVQIGALTTFAATALGVGELVRNNVTPAANLPEPETQFAEVQVAEPQPVTLDPAEHEQLAEAVAARVHRKIRQQVSAAVARKTMTRKR